ncbi:MAG: alpha/beta hydrolase fold domain-containing protein, partial [Acholeplasmataceae bacterium]|nr:alpha/beta hydrolase fold domain-containing protein [Acholeplasmataceae bacterium]
MKTYVDGSINKISKMILNYVSSNETFLEQAKKEKPEKIPFFIKSKYHIKTRNNQNHLFHTINEKSDNHKHIIYFHGGALCLNGGLPQWMMIDKWVKKTNAKATYVEYPLIPQVTTSEIYNVSFEIYLQIISEYPFDELILIGDSAGGLVILSMLQLIDKIEVKKP